MNKKSIAKIFLLYTNAMYIYGERELSIEQFFCRCRFLRHPNSHINNSIFISLVLLILLMMGWCCSSHSGWWRKIWRTENEMNKRIEKMRAKAYDRELIAETSYATKVIHRVGLQCTPHIASCTYVPNVCVMEYITPASTSWCCV